MKKTQGFSLKFSNKKFPVHSANLTVSSSVRRMEHFDEVMSNFTPPLYRMNGNIIIIIPGRTLDLDNVHHDLRILLLFRKYFSSTHMN